MQHTISIHMYTRQDFRHGIRYAPVIPLHHSICYVPVIPPSDESFQCYCHARVQCVDQKANFGGTVPPYFNIGGRSPPCPPVLTPLHCIEVSITVLDTVPVAIHIHYAYQKCTDCHDRNKCSLMLLFVVKFISCF